MISKKYIFTFFCFTFVMNCLGQDYLGTWELASSRTSKTNKQYINICCKDSYRRLYISIDDYQNYTGHEWGSAKIIFNNGKKLTKIPDKYYDTILSVKGDTLTILDAENYIYVYFRIAQKQYDSLLDLITPKYRNYNKGLVFTNSLNKNKKIIFDAAKDQDFLTIMAYDTTFDANPILLRYFGNITDIDSNNIYYKGRLTFEKEITNTEGFKSNIRYQDYDTGISVPFNSIYAFNIRKYKSVTTANLGGFFIASGIFTTLVLAPLVSINYHNADFNSKRYYHWALAGLAGTGIGLTLNLTHKPRRIDILQPNETPSKNKWRVQYYKK